MHWSTGQITPHVAPAPATPQEHVPERRAHHRVPCTADGALVIRVWRLNAGEINPQEPRAGTTAATTTPVDLSAGGAGLLVADADVKRLRLARGVLVGLLIERKESHLLLHGEIRRITTRADGFVHLGICVELPEMSLERRRSVVKLEALVATIRRIELEHLAQFGVAGAKQL
jgi:hypothetical protein